VVPLDYGVRALFKISLHEPKILFIIFNKSYIVNIERVSLSTINTGKQWSKKPAHTTRLIFLTIAEWAGFFDHCLQHQKYGLINVVG
jgi:hypothetical protein